MELLETLFSFAGGLGMFLYGMHIMGDGLQKAAGEKMKHFLEILTSNRFMAVLVGSLTTAIIQSSSATTVMVVGFVNAGLLTLTQATGIIMGANVGTTITSWIVSLNEIPWAAVFKPSFFAPLLVGIGAFVVMSAKKEKKQDAGEILTGFGILFIGLEFMSSAIKPYSNSPLFSNAFAVLGKNPFLGILAGAAVTAIIQSSSASVGILQTLALNGVVNWNSAVYITLGQNIGTCITALLSSTGANKTAKRAAVIHLLFNAVGAIVFGIALYIIFALNHTFAVSSISSVDISIFHTIFNITNTILLFPFANLLVKVSGILVKDNDENEEHNLIRETLKHLDDRILETPSFAIETAGKEIIQMGKISLDNCRLSIECLIDRKNKEEKVIEQEEIIDKLEHYITQYLIKINKLSLSEKQQLVVNHMFYTISNMERVGDHAENLAEMSLHMRKKNLVFSQEAIADLRKISRQTLDAYENAVLARETENMEYVQNVVKSEDLVDAMEQEMRESHVSRLSNEFCTTEAGVLFVDTLVNLERISDHSMNIAEYLKEELD